MIRITLQDSEAFLHHQSDIDIAFPLPGAPIFDGAVRDAESLCELTL